MRNWSSSAEVSEGRFTDRVEAGRRLAERLEGMRGPGVVVLGLPRGGVPVAAEVAEALDAPLDVIVVRKLGLPFQPELAMGAIGEGGARMVDEDLVAQARVSADELRSVEQRERSLLESRVRRLRRGRPRVELRGRTAIVVDDGIATGSTARVACAVARHLGAARVVLAVPVGPAGTAHRVPEADEVICLVEPRDFVAVGVHYRDFAPTTDDEVIVLLDAARHRIGRHATSEVPDHDLDLEVPVGDVALGGHLHLPEQVRGVVLFAHGSGSSRLSPRNRFVASVLQRAGLGTLLFDLLTPDEEPDRANVFDIPLLAGRLLGATRWVRARPDARGCRVGYFGASTGAGAALWAAADAGDEASAVVSRGGRPDLAGRRLALVRAPTLLVVGSRDEAVLELNREARRHLRCPSELAVVEGATHLFDEPGTLAEVAILAAEWFTRHLLDVGAATTGKAAS
jgi:putative phosphoribosyl transferase